jgi:DUF1707 SHOCT-like domain
MSDGTAQHASPAVRASDAEREQTVTLLQRSFADGRLALAELEERASAAYAARTRAELRELTADLPAAVQPQPRRGTAVDTRLLCILLCVCPPAGAAYWLLSLRQTTRLRARLLTARPRRQLLAAAIVAGAGAALQITLGDRQLGTLSHLAGAVLISIGVILALPAISRRLHRAGARAPRSSDAQLRAPADGR